jgi:hypothetical protein
MLFIVLKPSLTRPHYKAISVFFQIFIHYPSDWLIGWLRSGPRRFVDRAWCVFGCLHSISTACSHACNIGVFSLGSLHARKHNSPSFPAAQAGTMLGARHPYNQLRVICLVQVCAPENPKAPLIWLSACTYTCLYDPESV